jgi:hypothetical protein
MIEGSKLQDGDKIFLFTAFSYDYSMLPLNIMEGVDLIKRPEEDDLYSVSDVIRPYCYALPALSVNMPVPHVCIRISSKYSNQDEIFWDLILALRLLKPLHIGVSGSFIYSAVDKCANPALYNLFSVLNAEDIYKISRPEATHRPSYQYMSADFKIVAQLLKKIRSLRCKPSKNKRLLNALHSFGSITRGQGTTYSIIFDELFKVLGSLFASAKSARLGYSVDEFFMDVQLRKKTWGKWVTLQYTNKRNKVSHGNPMYLMSGNKFSFLIGKTQYYDLFKLHEIARLSLLGFLGLSNKQLDGHSQKTVADQENLEKSKNFLKQLKTSPEFLKNQTMWAKKPIRF